MNKMTLDENKLLEEYIEQEFSDCKPIDDDMKKIIADSIGFNRYCLGVAWDACKAELKKIFPFNLFCRNGEER